MHAGAAGEPDRSADVIVVRQSKVQRDGLLGGLVTLFIAAFAGGALSAATTGGRIAAAVFGGIVVAVLVLGWIRTVRNSCHLEISDRSVTAVGARFQPITLSREGGNDLRFITTGSARYRSRGLIAAGSSTVIPLPYFSLREIRRQCAARGWQFQN
jgi:hypothetical protein